MDYARNPNTSCIICNKAIYRRPKEILLNHGNVFCGKLCYGKHIRKEHPCPICGRLVMAKFNKKTCSRACANKRRAGMHYKIGGPRKDKAEYFRRLKLDLLETRDPRCERCDYNKIEILQIHHKDRDRNNNNLNNLELVCPNCHYEDHFLEKSWLKRYNSRHS
jgi:hypothetical protein